MIPFTQITSKELAKKHTALRSRANKAAEYYLATNEAQPEVPARKLTNDEMKFVRKKDEAQYHKLKYFPYEFRNLKDQIKEEFDDYAKPDKINEWLDKNKEKLEIQMSSEAIREKMLLQTQGSYI